MEIANVSVEAKEVFHSARQAFAQPRQPEVSRGFICLHLSLYDWPRRLSCREIKMHAGMGRFNLESLKYLRICGIWQHSFTIDKRRN